MSAGPDVPARVVVVDDDRLIREMVRDAIGDLARVECCDSSEAALEALHREPADLVVSDLTMPGLSGIELLEEVRRSYPATDFMLLTGDATVESAVGALRMGAADYLTKPINGDELALVVERILAKRRLLEENGHRTAVSGYLAAFESAGSASLRASYRDLAEAVRAAPIPEPIAELICGAATVSRRACSTKRS